MSISISYNGQSLTPTLGKIRYSETVDKATFQVDFYTAASGLAALLDALNDWDQDLSITSGDFTRSYSVDSNTAVAIRTTAAKAGHMMDATDGSKVRVTFTAIVERIADTSGDNYWREWSCTVAENEQGANVLTMKALVTAGGGNSAQDNYDAQASTRVGVFMTALGLSSSDFEDPNTTYEEIDRHQHITLVTSTYVQLYETVSKIDSGDSESKDTSTVFVDWDIDEITQEERGHDQGQVKLYRVRWGARVKLSASLTKSQIEADFLGIVIKRLQTQFGETSTPTLIGNSQVSISSTKQIVRGDWQFRVSADGGLISFIETVTLRLSVAFFDKYTDGKDFTGDLASPGLMGTLIQEVTVTQEDATPDLPPAPVLTGFGGARLGLVELEEIRGEGRDGRDIGQGSYKTRAAVENHQARFIATYEITREPENSPLGGKVSGVKSDPNRAVDLFKSS